MIVPRISGIGSGNKQLALGLLLKLEAGCVVDHRMCGLETLVCCLLGEGGGMYYYLVANL